MSALISKLPWQFHANDRTGERGGRSLLIVDATGRTLLQVNDYSDRDEHEAIANAAFIARACNAHDALVAAVDFMLAYENDDEAALEEIQEAFNQQESINAVQEFARCYCARKMSAALAKASPRPSLPHIE